MPNHHNLRLASPPRLGWNVATPLARGSLPARCPKTPAVGAPALLFLVR